MGGSGAEKGKDMRRLNEAAGKKKNRDEGAKVFLPQTKLQLSDDSGEDREKPTQK